MINYTVHCNICGYRDDAETPIDIDNGYCGWCGDDICQHCTTKEHEECGVVHIGCYEEEE